MRLKRTFEKRCGPPDLVAAKMGIPIDNLFCEKGRCLNLSSLFVTLQIGKQQVFLLKSDYGWGARPKAEMKLYESWHAKHVITINNISRSLVGLLVQLKF